MKKTYLFILPVLLCLILINNPVQADSVYQGNYDGTFVGNFEGQWTCSVDGDGNIDDWAISLAPRAKGTGRIDSDGNLSVTLNIGPRKTVWTASVTSDLKIVDGKLNSGGTFKGQGRKQTASGIDSIEPSKAALKVVTLGTGTPMPNPDRACAATLVMAGKEAFLFDTGRGVVNGLLKSGNPDITAVLFTHYHSDHFGELGEILVGRAIAGAAPLQVIGPVGAKRIVSAFQELYALDNTYRKAHHNEKWKGFQVEVQEAEPGVVYNDGTITIRMFTVDHAPVEPAVGYRLEYAGQSVVISGDTQKVPEMVEMAQGCDILVHDALNRQMVERALAGMQDNPRTKAMAMEMMEYHATTIEVAEIARKAGVRKLVLTHLVPSIPPVDQAEQLFIQGMADIFNGPIIIARDGLEIEVTPNR